MAFHGESMEKKAPARCGCKAGGQGGQCLILKGSLQSTEVGVAIQRLKSRQEKRSAGTGIGQSTMGSLRWSE